MGGVRGEQELPFGQAWLPGDTAATGTSDGPKRSPLRLLTVEICVKRDDTHTARITHQGWDQRMPLDLVLYTSDYPIRSIRSMLGCLQAALDEAMSTYERERGIL